MLLSSVEVSNVKLRMTTWDVWLIISSGPSDLFYRGRRAVEPSNRRTAEPHDVGYLRRPTEGKRGKPPRQPLEETEPVNREGGNRCDAMRCDELERDERT
ncbi:hypothetical protein E4U54_000070 [Claviceps lovelessii]|nr:hypothetical protein E4U54_000070 [Claviceps lovelessii]